MRGSSFTTFLMFLPLIAVPLLAIFGIPEFRPVNASSPTEAFSEGVKNPQGDSPTARRSDARSSGAKTSSPADLFAPIDEQDEPLQRGLSRIAVPQREDPFNRDDSAADSRRGPIVTKSTQRLSGWSIDRTRAPAHQQANRTALNESPPEERSLRVRTAGVREAAPFPAGVSMENVSFEVTGSPVAPRADRFAEAPLRRHNGTARNVTIKQGTDNAGGESLTWQNAIGRLNQMGITNYLLQPGSRPNVFHFSCNYEVPDNPRVTHRFEAEDTDPLRAVGKVLQQIDARRQMDR